MKSVFEKLKKLQEVLLKEFGIEEELDDIPKELNEQKERFHKFERSFVDKEALLKSNRTMIGEISKEKEQLLANKEKYEGQITIIKTQKEYEAITSEIAQINEKLESIEDEETSAVKEIETLESRLEQLKEVIKELKGDIGKNEKEVKKLSDKKKKELDSCLKEKEKISEGLDEEVLYKFEKIVKNKEGIGIISIQKNVCMGCNMVLPPQFVNDVRREDKLIFCPNCSRILYYQDDTQRVEELIV